MENWSVTAINLNLKRVMLSRLNDICKSCDVSSIQNKYVNQRLSNNPINQQPRDMI